MIIDGCDGQREICSKLDCDCEVIVVILGGHSYQRIIIKELSKQTIHKEYHPLPIE